MSAPEVDSYIGNFLSGTLGAAIFRILLGSAIKKFENLPDEFAKIQATQALILQEIEGIKEDQKQQRQMLEHITDMVHQHDVDIAVLNSKGCLKPKGKPC